MFFIRIGSEYQICTLSSLSPVWRRCQGEIFSILFHCVLRLKSMLFAEDVVILARKARWLLLVAKHEAWIMFSHWQRWIARLDGYCKHACNGFDISGTGSEGSYKDRNSVAEHRKEVKWTEFHDREQYENSSMLVGVQTTYMHFNVVAVWHATKYYSHFFAIYQCYTYSVLKMCHTKYKHMLLCIEVTYSICIHHAEVLQLRDGLWG